MTTAPTIRFDIFMAGDLAQAKQVCREYCFEVGLCVTIEPVDFIYTGGEESGFRIGLINYPRFPTPLEALHQRAAELADLLMKRLCQHSYSIVGPNETEWFSRRPGAETNSAERFHGAKCPSYPNCTGGCGLGCTHDVEAAKTAAALTPSSPNREEAADTEAVRGALLSDDVAGRIAVELQSRNRFTDIATMRMVVDEAIRSTLSTSAPAQAEEGEEDLE